MLTRFASAVPAPAGPLFPAEPSSFMDDVMNLAATASDRAASRELVPLLSGIASGDRSALATLYQRTSAKLYGICARLLPSEADAQDVLQDVYLTVWRKAGQYDETKASPVTWLAVMARNKAIDRLRARKIGTDPLEAADEVPDDSATAFEIVEQGQARDRLAHCLDELEAGHAGAIRAAFLDGLTYAELAARDAVPLGTMKSWIRRGLLRLRGCLER
ncbi:MAG: sigma-70 family RNA polymerase sigma factor [Sphingomicrobium sp.]